MLENSTMTQTSASLIWEADDPWRDWNLYIQKMMEASDQILSIQIQNAEDKLILQTMKNIGVPKSSLSDEMMFLSGIHVMNTQKPIYLGGYL
jgi:hypothetical protein